MRCTSASQSWTDPDAYEAEAWKLGTPRGEHVRRRRLQAVLPLLSDAELVLDVGVGPATLSRDFKPRVVGADLSATMLCRAKERIWEVVRAHSEYLPFRDGSFDVVFESSCLYLTQDKLAMLLEMRRVSSDSVVVFESNRLSLRRLWDKYFRRRGMYPEHPTPGEVRGYMKKAGLDPQLRLVGFAPPFGGKHVLRIFSPLESLIEYIPLVRLFSGGILAHVAHSKS